MKILAVGDIHGDTDLARSLSEKADSENVDLVVICGDITQNEASTENLVGMFKQKVLLVPGNHESLATADFLAELYEGKNLHGYAMNLEDISFFGCGSANIGLFQLTEDEIFHTLKKGFNYSKNSKKRIMVTHVHPSGSMMENFSKFVPGSSGVKKAIDDFKPDFLLCSHVHEAEGIEEKIGKTTVINVGRKGKILEI